MGNLFSKFERCMLFRFRVNGGRWTDGQTDGVWRVMRPYNGARNDNYKIESTKAVFCRQLSIATGAGEEQDGSGDVELTEAPPIIDEDTTESETESEEDDADTEEDEDDDGDKKETAATTEIGIVIVTL